MDMQVRRACPGDRPAIEALNQEARRTLPLLWEWQEHLADDLFIVVDRGGDVVGTLLAWPDQSPVAWVRLAALDDMLEVDRWLDLTLSRLLDELGHREVRSLAWMDCQGWAGPHLCARGFHHLTNVITLSKHGRTLPAVPEAVGVCIRPAQVTDDAAIAALDRAAFTPHWWYSEATIRRKAAAVLHFVVAEAGGRVVGYAEGELRLPTAHLNRLAVHPIHQSCGIGALLLQDALRAFWQQNADWVTLNTQSHNERSRRLYHRFGFEATGESMAVWELEF
ncbi:MAG: GNAT family N-acetyltransferase [Anaerolineae bacterium]|nr:GNAT family N-acetyltransferase [Anaerolineae bacterium]